MYSDGVERTQIYLGEEELELLDREAERSGASRSELIRRAIRRQFAVTSVDERRRALRETAGALKSFPMTGGEYVDSIRGDLNERLRRLGLE